MQLDLKARAEIPRCTSGSGGSGGAGWCSSSGCGGSAGGSSKSSNESKDPCVNAFDFKFGEQNKLVRSGNGPENSQCTSSSSSTSSSGSGNWNRSRRIGVLVGG